MQFFKSKSYLEALENLGSLHQQAGAAASEHLSINIFIHIFQVWCMELAVAHRMGALPPGLEALVDVAGNLMSMCCETKQRKVLTSDNATERAVK